MLIVGLGDHRSPTKETKVDAKARNTARKLPAVSPQDDDELYLQDNTDLTIAVEHFKKDRICTLCGMWETEHHWDVCQDPNWL